MRVAIYLKQAVKTELRWN